MLCRHFTCPTGNSVLYHIIVLQKASGSTLVNLATSQKWWLWRIPPHEDHGKSKSHHLCFSCLCAKKFLSLKSLFWLHFLLAFFFCHFFLTAEITLSWTIVQYIVIVSIELRFYGDANSVGFRFSVGEAEHHQKHGCSLFHIALAMKYWMLCCQSKSEMLSWPCLPLLSIAFHCLSLAFHCFPLLSIAFYCLLVAFHCFWSSFYALWHMNITKIARKKLLVCNSEQMFNYHEVLHEEN